MQYTHTFQLTDAECQQCKATTVHAFALVSTNKAFNNAKRQKACTVCNTVTEAPVAQEVK